MTAEGWTRRKKGSVGARAGQRSGGLAWASGFGHSPMHVATVHTTMKNGVPKKDAVRTVSRTRNDYEIMSATKARSSTSSLLVAASFDLAKSSIA